MDLGFGGANQVVGNVAARVLLESTEAQESALDEELAKYDELLNDDDALDRLREARLAQLQQQSKQASRWKDAGHGVYTELDSHHDKAKAFFEAAKQSERLVLHFYRPTTRYCQVFHRHLTELATKHLETRFLKINVEDAQEGRKDGVAYLVDKLGIVVMPTLLLVRKRKAIHHIQGFDELGGSQDFSTQTLEYVLKFHNMLFRGSGGGEDDDEDFDEEPPEELLLNSSRGVNSIRLQQGARRGFDKYNDQL